MIEKNEELAYAKNLKEIFDFTVLRMNTRDDTLQVRDTLNELGEIFFERRVLHEVLHGIQPSVNGGDFLQWHAEPNSE